ncbi:molybdopterin synthase large subunit CnxH [Histoplasma capsulatum var. duboisii H88]|uniref:Molybdopterin synthase large subunit CnxH n=1 Tax=Ajellomyces capsulatus (strain H88) TaxID=544711 RepID=A0A8A1LMY5_AJEC8|nr:molybdopterin synthase large subunit CnxH [Histoplasma capsulatum var. duboisii H88]
MDILKVVSISVVETYGFHIFDQVTTSFRRQVFWTLFIVQYVVLKTYCIWIYPLIASPLRSLPGPNYTQFLLGQTYNQITASCPNSIALAWMKKFPDADLIRYFAPGNHEVVLVNSPRAFREVTFTHAYSFAKPRFFKRLVGDMIGGGLFFAEGDVHRKQKKLLAGPFLNKNVKHLLPVFEQNADELSSSIETLVVDSETGAIEISCLISKSLLDIISQAILGLELDGHSIASELGRCYHTIFSSTTMSRVMLFLNTCVPVRRLLPVKTNREYTDANIEIKQILKKHVQQRTHEIRSLWRERLKSKNKDILTLIIQEQLKKSDEFPEDEIVDHLRTFLAAGKYRMSSILNPIANNEK